MVAELAALRPIRRLHDFDRSGEVVSTAQCRLVETTIRSLSGVYSGGRGAYNMHVAPVTFLRCGSGAGR